jgi:hypothetical protein
MEFASIQTMETIICPQCGQQMTTGVRVREMVTSYPEKIFCGQCRCGEKYKVRRSFLNSLIYSFPDRSTVFVC